MTRAARTEVKEPGRKIIGFSLSRELARKVKIEASSRQLSLKKLFEEMWALYQKHGKKK